MTTNYSSRRGCGLHRLFPLLVLTATALLGGEVQAFGSRAFMSLPVFTLIDLDPTDGVSPAVDTGYGYAGLRTEALYVYPYGSENAFASPWTPTFSPGPVAQRVTVSNASASSSVTPTGLLAETEVTSESASARAEARMTSLWDHVSPFVGTYNITMTPSTRLVVTAWVDLIAERSGACDSTGYACALGWASASLSDGWNGDTLLAQAYSGVPGSLRDEQHGWLSLTVDNPRPYPEMFNLEYWVGALSYGFAVPEPDIDIELAAGLVVVLSLVLRHSRRMRSGA